MSERKFLDREVLEVIREQYDHIFSAEKKVASFVLQNPQKAVECNVSELAKNSGVSDATVVRMCHHIGYTGYYQFRITLARDLGKQQYSSVDEIESKDSVEKMFGEFAKAMLVIGRRMDLEVVRGCVNLLKTCKQAHIMAVGNTCPLAQYMGFRLGRLGIKSTYGLSPEYFLNNVNLADKGDILVAISQSGTSRQVIQGMQLGKDKGLKMIAITAFAQSPVSALADYVLLSAGEEGPFSYYKGYAHLNETAVIDALLNFVTNDELIKTTQSDKLEMILSEYKM